MKKSFWILPVLLVSSAWADFTPMGTGYNALAPNTCTQPGQYSMVTNLSALTTPPNACGFAASLAPESGKSFMLVDGNTAAVPYMGQTGPMAGVVWSETVNITSPQTFSVWVADVDDAVNNSNPYVNTDTNPATLVLYANGASISTFPVPANGTNPLPKWVEWVVTVNPSAGPTTLLIRDTNSNDENPPGDDFGLDNLNVTPEPAELPVCLVIAGGLIFAWRARRSKA